MRLAGNRLLCCKSAIIAFEPYMRPSWYTQSFRGVQLMRGDTLNKFAHVSSMAARVDDNEGRY
jgi:hypothetical protein